MAKRIPTASIEDMEAYMRYSLRSKEWAYGNRQIYYSDLELVPTDVHSRTLREYEEEKRFRALCGHHNQNNSQDFETKVIRSDENDIAVTRMDAPGHYVFDVKVSYGFGLLLPFLFTESEVQKSICRPKIHQEEQLYCHLLTLPKELRDRIYELAIPTGTWEKPKGVPFLQNVAEGLGTRCGFYFPFKHLSLLETCRQIRTEALALAFRKTKFCLDDIDEVVQLLIAAGTVGRQNIRALEFSWLSKSDQDLQWQSASANEEFYPTLPCLHIEECTALLRQCCNLTSLCLKFDDVSIADLSAEALKKNHGIRLLCSIHHLQNLKVVDIEGDPLEHVWFTEWLQEQLISQ